MDEEVVSRNSIQQLFALYQTIQSNNNHKTETFRNNYGEREKYTGKQQLLLFSCFLALWNYTLCETFQMLSANIWNLKNFFSVANY